MNCSQFGIARYGHRIFIGTVFLTRNLFASPYTAESPAERMLGGGSTSLFFVASLKNLQTSFARKLKVLMALRPEGISKFLISTQWNLWMIPQSTEKIWSQLGGPQNRSARGRTQSFVMNVLLKPVYFPMKIQVSTICQHTGRVQSLLTPFYTPTLMLRNISTELKETASKIVSFVSQAAHLIVLQKIENALTSWNSQGPK